MPHDYKEVASGVLFKNDDKEEGSKKPDYSGPGKLQDGTEVQIAAWVKEKNGRKFMSWNLQEKHQQSSGGQQSGGGGAAPPDDDIPF